MDQTIALLKSDHFGIEMSFTSPEKLPHGTLKSDHFGIEIDQMNRASDRLAS